MSVLSIDHDNFEIRYGDLVDNIEVSVWVNREPGVVYAREYEYANNKSREIKEAILKLQKSKITGTDLKRIIKRALGVTMRCRCSKACYPKGYQLRQYFEISDPAGDPMNKTDTMIPIPKTDFYLRSISINTKLNMWAPHDNYLF